MFEGNIRQPVNADMDIITGFLSAGNVQIAPFRRAGANKDRIERLGEKVFQAVDALAQPHLRAHGRDIAHFLIQHFFGQAEFGDLRADHAAGFSLAVKYNKIITKGGEIACNRHRGGASPDQRDPFAVFLFGHFGHAGGNITLIIGRDPFEAADRHRFFLDAAAPTGWLAGAVAGAAQNARKHIGFPVDHKGIGIAAFGDQTDIFRHRSVGGTGPLAVNNLMIIIRIFRIRRLQVIPPGARPCSYPQNGPTPASEADTNHILELKCWQMQQLAAILLGPRRAGGLIRLQSCCSAKWTARSTAT